MNGTNSGGSSFGDLVLGYLNGRSQIDLQQRSMATVPGYVDTQYNNPYQQGGSAINTQALGATVQSALSNPMVIAGLLLVGLLGFILLRRR